MNVWSRMKKTRRGDSDSLGCLSILGVVFIIMCLTGDVSCDGDFHVMATRIK